MTAADFRLDDSAHVGTVAVCGDWHGDYLWARRVIRRALGAGADVIVQAGDFGFGFGLNDTHLNAISEAALEYDLPVLFVDGNHENFDKLLALPVRDDGLRPVADGVFHLPRGLTWEWAGKRWLAAGGGYSVDKPYREEGQNWWPQETITDAELIAITAVGKMDVLVTHDTDDQHNIPGTHRTAQFFDADQIAISEQHRAKITRIINATQPALAFHGHYHVSYDAMVDQTHVVGLDINGARWMDDHVKFIDAATLKEV